MSLQTLETAWQTQPVMKKITLSTLSKKEGGKVQVPYQFADENMSSSGTLTVFCQQSIKHEH